MNRGRWVRPANGNREVCHQPEAKKAARHSEVLMQYWNLESEFPRIAAPILLLCGDWVHGGAIRDEDAVYFKENLPQVVEIKIPDASHESPWEQADITVRHIQNFLQSV